jgi:hypothetical protein
VLLPIALAQISLENLAGAGRGMDHPTFAGINSDMRNRATVAGVEKQQVARQDLASRVPGLKLCGGGARYPDAGLPVGVLHQAAAIHSAGRFSSQQVRCPNQALGSFEDALACRGVVAGHDRRCGATTQPE